MVRTVLPDDWLSKKLPSYWRRKRINLQLKKTAPDIFHGLSHELPLGIEKTSIKSVVTMHDLIFERYPDQYKAVDRFIYRKKFMHACRIADTVIAISQQTRNDLIELYKVPAEKIVVCYQSCNPAFADPVSESVRLQVRNRYQLPKSYLLYVGSVVERKNLLGLCKAFDIIRNDTDLPLVIIGSGGAYLQKVKAFLKEKQLEDRCIFLSETAAAKASADFQTARDLPAIYQQAAAMVYPSFYEGFGIPVLEALWSGIPVVTSDCSCLPEAGGPGAFYADPGNAQEIAEQICTILFDSKEVERKRALYQEHLQHFTNACTADGVMNVYKNLMK